MKKSNNNDSFVTIAKFTSSAEANIAKSKLDAAEIQCFIDNENYLYTGPFLGYVNLKVWGKDKEQALMVLGLELTPDEEVDIVDNTAAICPHCKKNDTAVGLNRNYAGTLFVVWNFFLQSLPFYKKKIRHCNNCKKHFKVVGETAL